MIKQMILIIRDKITIWWLADVCKMPHIAANYIRDCQKQIREES